jgi:hypothetical protein
MPVMVIVPLTKPLDPTEVLVRVDVKKFEVRSGEGTRGFLRHEPSLSGIVRWVKQYDETFDPQEKTDMVMTYLGYWPLLITRGMEFIQDRPQPLVALIAWDPSAGLTPPRSPLQVHGGSATGRHDRTKVFGLQHEFKFTLPPEVALDLASGADFRCNRRCTTSPVDQEGSWGQVLEVVDGFWKVLGRRLTDWGSGVWGLVI